VRYPLLLVTVTTLACGAAFAQDEPAQTQAAADDGVSSIFTQLDANKDGSISTDEAQASPVVARSFVKADANGDGSISRDEFMSSFTTRAPADSAPPAESTPPPSVPPPQ
jgi:EF hand